MKLKKNRRVNRKYLRKTFFIKTFFLPVLILVEKTGSVKYLEGFLNRIIRVLGIKKNIHFFFKYKDLCNWFRDDFREDAARDGIILFPMMTGVNGNISLMNLLFSKYMMVERNLRPELLICDSAVDICSKDGRLKSRKTNPMFCRECWKGYRDIAKETGIPTSYFSEFLKDSQEILITEQSKIDNLTSVESCESYEFENVPIGYYCRKSVLRYFLMGSFSGNSDEVVKYKEFLISALRYNIMINNFLIRNPDVRYMVLHNGTLAFESIARHHASSKGIPYMTYETFLGTNGLIYKKNDEVMKLDWSNKYEKFKENFVFDKQAYDNAESFFGGLKSGALLYSVLNREHSAKKMKGVERYVCLFTNMNFDTAVLDRNTIFENMEEWLYRVIDFWKASRTDLTLVIRIHPAEYKLVTASKEFMGDKIGTLVQEVPNIILIDSNEKVNSYELLKGMEYGLVYASTIGLEAAYHGKITIVAGKPYFRNKSFLITPSSRDEYFDVLRQANRGELKFDIDHQELIRTVNFTYFERRKQLNGIKVYTPDEEPNTEYDNPEEMILNNRTFFDDFARELIDEE